MKHNFLAVIAVLVGLILITTIALADDDTNTADNEQSTGILDKNAGDKLTDPIHQNKKDEIEERGLGKYRFGEISQIIKINDYYVVIYEATVKGKEGALVFLLEYTDNGIYKANENFLSCDSNDLSGEFGKALKYPPKERKKFFSNFILKYMKIDLNQIKI